MVYVDNDIIWNVSRKILFKTHGTIYVNGSRGSSVWMKLRERGNKVTVLTLGIGRSFLFFSLSNVINHDDSGWYLVLC